MQAISTGLYLPENMPADFRKFVRKYQKNTYLEHPHLAAVLLRLFLKHLHTYLLQ